MSDNSLLGMVFSLAFMLGLFLGYYKKKSEPAPKEVHYSITDGCDEWRMRVECTNDSVWNFRFKRSSDAKQNVQE